mmetsp:Transcript_29530/g.77705  ORF Transcript_29530/g.77705 Transcript_29530/m.77705 type:complete len:228 (+) Transcript_29530:59-742(+)
MLISPQRREQFTSFRRTKMRWLMNSKSSRSRPRSKRRAFTSYNWQSNRPKLTRKGQKTFWKTPKVFQLTKTTNSMRSTDGSLQLAAFFGSRPRGTESRRRSRGRAPPCSPPPSSSPAQQPWARRRCRTCWWTTCPRTWRIPSATPRAPPRTARRTACTSSLLTARRWSGGCARTASSRCLMWTETSTAPRPSRLPPSWSRVRCACCCWTSRPCSSCAAHSGPVSWCG